MPKNQTKASTPVPAQESRSPVSFDVRVYPVKDSKSIRTKPIRLAATRRSGEGYIDTAVKILIAVVLGALLLAGLYALFGDVVMPTLNQRIKDMFNYAGALGG